jgi:conjugal transfer pilus assembly protein TraW
MKLNKKFIFGSIKLLMIFSISLSANAKDFGTQGHSYQITEQEFLQMIAERLKKIDMKKEQEKMQKVVRDRVENPRAIEAVKPATSTRSFYFDPTYTLDKDVVLPCGKILHRAGTQVNPLEHMDLNRRLLFIDARRIEQVKWLREELDKPLPDQKDPVEDRVILVGGSPSTLKKLLKDEHKNKVYFDQNGELTTRFGITGSPAVVVQDGLRLKIDEIKLIQK